MAYRAGVQRLILAVLGGGALTLAFPTYGIWVLAPIGLALVALATTGVGVARGFGLGLVSGLAFFVPTLSWAGVYVGALPWLALSGLQAVFVGLVGGAHGALSRTRARPLVLALAWVGAEALRARVPYGGFPWVKLATSQADSPFGHLAALAGAPGVGFAVALSGGLLAVAAVRPRRSRQVLAAVGGALATAATGLFVSLPTEGAVAQVMAVQGNVPRPGLDFNAERRAVLDNHVRATLDAAQQVGAGTRAHPDLVIWPENSSDIDPTRNPDAQSAIQQAVDAIGAPVVVGTLYDRDATVFNVSLTYVPHVGVVGEYVKQHPVPFAEYIPDRAFWRLFSDKVDLLQRDYSAGDHRGIVEAPTASGATVRAGLSICFEVAYDDLVRDQVTHGANLLVVQTNNATFGYTAESEQQLAVSRIRAMEHGRSVVHVSTVGVSALVTPDGTPHDATSLFTTAVLSGGVPLRDTLTVATRVAAWPELAAVLWLLMLVARHSVLEAGSATRLTVNRERNPREGNDAAEQ
jgi:apolipoprotein N-acyltransferase